MTPPPFLKPRCSPAVPAFIAVLVIGVLALKFLALFSSATTTVTQSSFGFHVHFNHYRQRLPGDRHR